MCYKYKSTTSSYCTGPKNVTLADFWRMICQENVKFIVMLTNIIENGKVSISTNYNLDVVHSSVHLNTTNNAYLITIHLYHRIDLCVDNFLTTFLLICIQLVFWDMNKTLTLDSLVNSGYIFRNLSFNLDYFKICISEF